MPSRVNDDIQTYAELKLNTRSWTHQNQNTRTPSSLSMGGYPGRMTARRGQKARVDVRICIPLQAGQPSAGHQFLLQLAAIR